LYGENHFVFHFFGTKQMQQVLQGLYFSFFMLGFSLWALKGGSFQFPIEIIKAVHDLLSRCIDKITNSIHFAFFFFQVIFKIS